MRHVGLEVVEQRLPARQHRLRAGPHAQQPQRRRIDQPDRGGAGIAHAVHPHQCCGRGRKQLFEPAELAQQRLGERLRVAAGNGEHQQELDQLVIGERFGAMLDQPVAQAHAVARDVEKGVGHRADR